MSIHWTTAPARVSHWIDNEIHQGGGEGSSPVFDPAHGRVARTAEATAASTSACVARSTARRRAGPNMRRNAGRACCSR